VTIFGNTDISVLLLKQPVNDTIMLKPVYKRILIKLSGEVFAGSKGFGLDGGIVDRVADEIKEVKDAGVQIGIVVGAGNIFRGGAAYDLDRTAADTIGMIATLINSLLLKQHLEKKECSACVMSAIPIPKAAEYFVAESARRHLEHGTIVIVAGGTGNPFFTTDTAAALRCAEIKADLLIKATKVDGVFDSDPEKNPAAKKFASITHADALAKNLKVMDATALSLCMENNIPIMVLKLLERGNLRKCVEGSTVGTIVKKGE
jgi:uridylate kinase